MGRSSRASGPVYGAYSLTPGCDPEVYGAPGTIGSRLVLDLVHDQLGGQVTIGRQGGFVAEIAFPHPRPQERVFTQS